MIAKGPSAQRAQRAEFQRLARHLITELHRRASAERDAAPSVNSPQYRSAVFVMGYLDSITDAKLAQMLDSYAPLIDAAAVDNEVMPLRDALDNAARRDGIGGVGATAQAGRVHMLIDLLTKEAE